MATMTIRNIDDDMKRRLRLQAASHGRSMEEEARDILRVALSTGTAAKGNLADTIRARFAPLGGVEIASPRREPMPDPIDLS